MILFSIDEFAAKRRGDQDDHGEGPVPVRRPGAEGVPAPTAGTTTCSPTSPGRTCRHLPREGGKRAPKPSAADFTRRVRATLDKTKDPDHNTADRVSIWLATAILNAATQALPPRRGVPGHGVGDHARRRRAAHPPRRRRPAAPTRRAVRRGRRRRCATPATRPPRSSCGSTAAAPSLRCSARTASHVSRTTGRSSHDRHATERASRDHRVLTADPLARGARPRGGVVRRRAPVRRRLAALPRPAAAADLAEAVRRRPRRLRGGRQDRAGSSGSTTMMRATGTFLQTPEADEAVGLIAEFGRFGVSVDADDAEFEFDDELRQGHLHHRPDRVRRRWSAIPAFAEAFMALGTWADQQVPVDQQAPPGPSDDECDPTAPTTTEPAPSRSRPDRARRLGVPPRRIDPSVRLRQAVVRLHRRPTTPTSSGSPRASCTCDGRRASPTTSCRSRSPVGR